MEDLIYDRTQQDVINKTPKGKHNISDLNRVETWCEKLAGLLNELGYPVFIQTKTDWTIEDMRYESEIERIRTNVATLKQAYYTYSHTPAVPDTLNRIDIDKANAIEKILFDIDKLLIAMQCAFVHSGVANCGQDRVWQRRFREQGRMINYEFGGASTQATRSGKNLANVTSPTRSITKNGVSITLSDDGLITLNGTSTNELWPDFIWGIELNTVFHDRCKYYFPTKIQMSLSKIVIDGTYSYDVPVTIAFNDDGETTLSNKQGTKTGSFSGINRAWFYIPNGAVFDNYKFYVQLTDTATPDMSYEPYGVMPSPEYPSPVVSLGETSKNLADISQIPNTDIIANNGDGTLTLANNTHTNGFANTGITLSQLCPNLNDGDTAVLSYETTSNMGNRNIIYLIDFSVSWRNNTSKSITQAMLDSRIYLYGGTDETAIISNFQIELGTQATYYRPHSMYVDIKNEGKNKLNGATLENLSSYVGEEIFDNKNCYKFDGYNKTEIIFSDSLKENTSYTLKISMGSTGSDGCEIRFYYTDGTYTVVIYQATGTAKLTTYTITSDSNKTLSYMQFSKWGTIGDYLYISKENLQLEQGTQSTPYTPYRPPTITYVPLAQPLREIGEYKDKIDWRNQRIERWMWEYEITGLYSGSNVYDTDSMLFTKIFATDSEYAKRNLVQPLVSNYFKYSESTIQSISVTGEWVSANENPQTYPNYAYFRIKPEVLGITFEATDTERQTAVNNWLQSLKNAGTPVLLSGVSSTPIYEPIELNIPLVNGTNELSIYDGLLEGTVERTYTNKTVEGE